MLKSRHAQKAIGERLCMHKSNRRAVLHAQKQTRHAPKQSGSGRACIKAIENAEMRRERPKSNVWRNCTEMARAAEKPYLSAVPGVIQKCDQRP